MLRFFSFFLLAFFLFPFSTKAAENPFLPSFCSNINQENPYFLDLQSEMESGKDFDESFEIIKKSYHTHINEVFNTQMTTLNQSYLVSKKSTEEACNILENEWDDPTSMKKIMAEELKILEQYKCALFAYQFDPIVTPEPLLEDTAKKLRTTENAIAIEIANAEYAFLMTLQMYSEMRAYYPVHRDLECLIQELTEYRNSLADFVDMVAMLPRKFLNFGTKNQR